MFKWPGSSRRHLAINVWSHLGHRVIKIHPSTLTFRTVPPEVLGLAASSAKYLSGQLFPSPPWGGALLKCQPLGEACIWPRYFYLIEQLALAHWWFSWREPFFLVALVPITILKKKKKIKYNLLICSVHCLSFSPECQVPGDTESYLFCFPVDPKYLAQCLEYARYLVENFWISEL